MQDGCDACDVLLQVFAVTVPVLLLGNRGYVHVVLYELGRHGLDRDNVIDEAGGGGTARHALHGGGVALRLGQREATVLLDGLDADGAVAANTRKDDADRTLAGGLAAFKSFLRHTPPDTGMAFVLVQHLDPNHKSLLVELLGAQSPVPVVAAKDVAWRSSKTASSSYHPMPP